MGSENAAHWRGATLGVALVTLALWLWFVAEQVTPASVLAPVVIGALGLLGAVALGAIAALLVRLARVRFVPFHTVWAVVAALPLLNVMTRVGLSSVAHLAVVLVVVGAAALAGGAIAALLDGGLRDRSGAGRAALVTALVAGAGTLLVGAGLLAWNGPGADRVPAPAAATADRAPGGADPFARGPFAVRRLTYGSGTDRHRAEFGARVTVRTRPVDGSAEIGGWSGFAGRARTSFWGFDASAMPVNGRVWYPDGRGPFPLVLVVHGDHLASDFSDAGYGYLGERLASRGYVVASVDENFLNSSAADGSAIGFSRFALTDDVRARAWLLLEHLRAWRDLERRPGTPLRGRVDLDRIALVGHSRGGEAVAAATVLNRRPGLRFPIRAVAAIAPTDDSYRPGGRPVRLRGADYLTIAGSHDGDVLSFVGTNQYHRTTLRPDGFKAAVAVYRANHGQFNTTWGRYDSGFGAARRLIGTNALLEPAGQRRVAGVFVSAFLDASLRGRRDRLRLLRDPAAGRAWLPETIYLKRFADAGTRALSSADDDHDRRTATAQGGRESGGGLTAWLEEGVPLRDGAAPDRAVLLGWDAARRGRPASFTLDPAAPVPAAGPAGELVFSLADAGPAESPIDLTVEATDRDGSVARLPLSHDAPLEPELAEPHLKIGAVQQGATAEPAFQTFALALADFARAAPGFDPSAVRRVRFVFDRTRAGRILLDDVGVRPRALP